MSTGKVQGPLGAVQRLSVKLPGFQCKLKAQRNPKFTREKEVMGMTLTPSAFLKEMSLSTEQKLALKHEMHPPRIIQLLDISETSFQKFSTVDIDQTLFQPFPSEIIFQNYTPHETYEVPLVLRNEDRIPRLVKVTQETSPYFKIISPSDAFNKVACGMQSTFRILFTPDENKDYIHELICVTEREKFVVPIRAIGARAILDFPDQLNFSTCPVKYSSQKTLLVRNIGNREARFQMSTSRPFSIEPSLGTMGIGESMQMTVEFKPQHIGDHSEDLVINYDTGETICVRLYGAAADINIRLDKNSLMIEKTFISMASQRMVTIINRSDIIAHFQWKIFATIEEEEQEKLRLYTDLQEEEEEETDRFLMECSSDPSLHERLAILSRTFYNRKNLVQGDFMLYSDDIFIIEPLEGDIWPNSTCEVNVIFKPLLARTYQSTIFCDITGREARLPLRIKAEGIGPKVFFNFDQLDIGKVFMNSTHGYEAILANKGYIEASFILMPPLTALGSGFMFNPSEGVILPGGHQLIQIIFSSSLLGEFTEVFMFRVDGSLEPISLTIRGCIIGPTFHFSTPTLNFGDVAFGFPCSLTCCLNNTSFIPMNFNLRIPGDGPGEPSITCSTQILDTGNTLWRKVSQGSIKPTEFTITPSHGTIRPQGLLNIQVTLCSNSVKKYELALVVDVDDIGEEMLALPITARCLMPLVHVEKPVLKFGRCFLQYPYQQMITLVNDSNLPGCYCVLSQEFEDQLQVLYSSPAPRGLIDPHSSAAIPIVLETQRTGNQETKVRICIFGSKEPTMEVHLQSTGVGPVVCVQPNELDFGKIPVLTVASRTLHLSNQSCIPARFQAQMVRSHSYWRIEPSEGVIPPEAEMTLTLVAQLDDTVKFNDKVQLAIVNSNTYTIPVQAKGTGNTIKTDRPFISGLNLGIHFSGSVCSYHFTMTNHGRRTYQLYWMTEGFPLFNKSSQASLSAAVKPKTSSTVLELSMPVFKLIPFRMDLSPGQSMDVVLEGSCDSAKVVKETLLCHALIGKSSTRELIMKVDVTCEFIAPLLQLSAKELKFSVKKFPDDVLTDQYRPLILKNISSLPLRVFLSLEEPFCICDREQNTLPVDFQPIKLQNGEEIELSIRFNPAYINDLNSRIVEDMLTIQYIDHPQKEFVILYGEVHFPNLCFQTNKVDFGCILNDTEVIQYIQMTNCSPLPVKYNWSFLTDDWENQIRFHSDVHKSSIAELPEKLESSSETKILTDITSFRKSVSNELERLQEEKDDANTENLEPPFILSADRLEFLEVNPELRSVTWPLESLPQEENHMTVGVEEVFDILPLYGILQPNESQQVSFTFFGHSDIIIQAKALCTVEGGPPYEIILNGEASFINYGLSTKEIDCGLQLFDDIVHADVVLTNRGKVGFDFTIPKSSQASSSSPIPGVPLILPSSGYIDSGGETILKISYLPGIPETFLCTFQIQVAHMEPDNITLKGEGIFPRICLDLQRNIKGNEKYQKFLDEAEIYLEKENKIESLICPTTNTGEPTVDDFLTNFDTLLQMEVERLLIKEHALQHQTVTSHPSSQTVTSPLPRKKLVKVPLPEYLLDFGYVIIGHVRTHIIKITNTGHFPVSFYADRKALINTGFSMELDRVKNLPYCETETFEVKFDPRSVNLPLGDIQIFVPIQVIGGPIYPICLHATVTMPSLSISCDKLDFNCVQCGQCKMKTLQLHNELHVVCEWAIGPSETVKNVDNLKPLKLTRKRRQNLKLKPQIFEMLPYAGVLLPGQRINVQVKFMPLEEKNYNQRLVLFISQSTQRLILQVQGQGLEPRLDFVPTMLELGPVLPLSPGDEVELQVKNPCSFPIEFYSLEHDKQYLEEEKILQMLKGYDSQNTLLLPARNPGEKLPQELQEFYEEQKVILEQQAKEREEKIQESALKAEEERISDQGEKQGILAVSASSLDVSSPQVELKAEEVPGEAKKTSIPGEKTQSIDEITAKDVGELETNPVSRAIARYLGIDISPEGRAALNRKGLAIVVHGSPLSGKTAMAVGLAKYYGAACLSIDSVVLEAISVGNTAAGLEARKLCIKAALEKAQRDMEETGFSLEGIAGQSAYATGGLSIEAVAKHTAEGSQATEIKTAPQSSISKGNKTSTGGGKIQGSRQQHHQSELATSQVTSSPVLGGPVQRRLSVSASVAGEFGLVSCVLPSELLVEILTDRLQLSDCFQGVVFDGLETLFARNFPSALLSLLKAFNNRNHIYVVTLSQEYETMMAHERAKKQAEEVEQESRLAKQRARLEEMDEDEYENLSEEERAWIEEERLKAVRERKKREQERLAQERKMKEALRKRQEEDELKRKVKRQKKDSAKEELPGKKSQSLGKQLAAALKSDAKQDSGVEKKANMKDRPESVLTEAEETNKKKKTLKVHSLDTALAGVSATGLEESETESLSDSDKQLLQRFKNYEYGQKEMAFILTLWDRVQGNVYQPTIADENQEEEQVPERQPPSGKKGKKDRERERLEKEKAEKERLEKEKAEKERLDKLKAIEEGRASYLQEGDGGEGIEGDEHLKLGVPHLDFLASGPDNPSVNNVLENDKLPSLIEILDALGLGSSGPPIPPDALFSVVPYPTKRKPRKKQDAMENFTFLTPPPSEVTSVVMDEKKETEPEMEAITVPSLKEESVTPPKSRHKKDKYESGRESTREKRRVASLKKSHSNLENRLTPPRVMTPVSADQGSLSGETVHERFLRLNNYRWIVPPNGMVSMRIHFASFIGGQYDQTLNFEILGTRRLYQVYCRGICSFPTISLDPMVVFPHRKKEAKYNEIIQKKFLMKTETFHFGPLLCGKSRERYKSGQFPENMEKIIIFNNSPIITEVFFCFQHDMKATTFILEPPYMTLNPNEKQELCVWAYPTTTGLIEDNIVCCIKNNPEPVIFKICCHGVRPELELDRKQLHFDKLLMHRKDTKTLFLRNSTLLSVAWRITGMDNLGEDFALSQDQGIIGPRSEFSLQIHFRGTRAINIKRFIRLEVSDIQNILGIVQIENIQIIAEAYDIALDISFPKGAEGGLDFGIIKTLDEAKQILSLKNKGKYEIGFSFYLETTEPGLPDLNSIFSILPQKGILASTDRPTQVQIIFHSKKEIQIIEKPILRCQVIEPNLSEGGETIASIPVKVSVQSVCTKYKISPTSGINFGAMIMGSRKLSSFIIENRGKIEFKYTISKPVIEVPSQLPKKGAPPALKRIHSREGSSSSRSIAPGKGKRSEPQKDSTMALQPRFSVGMFIISPGFGTISPGTQQTILVECFADQLGKTEELLSIDISDRDLNDQPSGITYGLVTEACIPGFVTEDMASVFEEHRIYKNINLYQSLQSTECDGIYVEDANKFIFTNVLVGHTAKARFKIVNAGKVPCDVIFLIKSVTPKSTSRSDIFELDPSRMCIPSHSHVFATVTFTPQMIQSYSCVFEAIVEGPPSLTAKARSLTFDILGEGNLPRVSILRPMLRNKQGNPLFLFKRLLIGHSEKLPLILKNEGTIPAQLHIDLNDEQGAFFLKPRPTTHCIYPVLREGQPEDMTFGTVQRAHTASLILNFGESAEFDILFKPRFPQRFEATIRLSVVDNQYEENRIQLMGEGYQDDLTLDNIHNLVATSRMENVEGQLKDDEMEATRMDHIQFGDCHVGKPYEVIFTMTNHSQVDAMRFEWPAETPLRFHPQVGHLHARCSKDITVTLKSDVTLSLHKNPVKCKVSRIMFTLPVDQIPDWDDRLHTVKWVDAGKSSPTRPTKKKVIETDTEPAHTVLDENSRELEVLVSANVDYAHFLCKMESVKFRDTLLFQTRTYQYQLTNTGNVQLEFSWQVNMEDNSKTVIGPQENMQSISEGESLLTSAQVASLEGRSSQTMSQVGNILESVSSLLTVGADMPPFSIEPSSGIILAGKHQNFLLKFFPLEVGDFEGKVSCSIPNVMEDQELPLLKVKGKSLLPYCHFELEDSDYITQNRRNPELREPQGAPPGIILDHNTRVIEFSTVGIHTKCTKSFKIINPTNAAYSFLWTCEDVLTPGSALAFRCFTKSGLIRAEKKAEISFEFHSQELDIVESFWTFTIPDHNISVPFLLVGNASEPLVSLDRTHLNFNSLMLGHEAHAVVYLINNEEQDFAFTFRENSCFSEGFLSNLVVKPMNGDILPRSRIPITILFTPTMVGEVNFNLICDIKNRTQPLTLNVKADGYTMDVSIVCEEKYSETFTLNAKKLNEINFKEVEINDPKTWHLSIVNNGKFSFSFDCKISAPKQLQNYLTIIPEMDFVEGGQCIKTELTFHPLKKCSLKAKLKIKISNGPIFNCLLLGNGVVPSIHFSFLKYDFGSCFIYHAGMPCCKRTLVITNKEEKELSLDCLFINTAYLEVEFQAEVLIPGGKMEVPITFYPREAIQYHETLSFEINGRSQQTVEIFGQGTEMKIEVLNPRHKVVNFGALFVGQIVKKIIPIVNNSDLSITFTLTVTPAIQALQDPRVLSLSPSMEITLKPQGTWKAEVIFSPKSRIPQFTEEVTMEHAGLSRCIFIIRGCSQGIEISLDQDNISFGAAVLQSHAVRRIVMFNTGDIGARFNWNIKTFQPDFSITPVEGYITPGMEVAFEVTFRPQSLKANILYENLKCFIEGSKPLKLTLSGSCVGVPAVKELMNFLCLVRSRHTQTILLSNRTNRPWHLKPIIEGEHWTGPDFIIVKAQQQNKPYEITYQPLTMTTEGKHQGSIFFPLPDGTGLYYLLQGTSEPPKTSGNIIREVPCKTSYNELLTVTNWLNRSQRFHVIIEFIKPEKLDPTVIVKGLDYHEVPAASKRDYKLTFFSYKEGVFNTKVTFRNETTQEYMFYFVTFKATPPGIISTIEMMTSVRQTASATVKVENPLSVPVTFSVDCKVSEISIPPHVTVPACSEGSLAFEYQPLKAGETLGRLVLQNSELGSYQYELILKAMPAKPEKPVYFSTLLGSSQVLSAKFFNYTRQKIEYTCKIDNNDFHVEKIIHAAAGSQGGTEVSVEVTYEPSQLGETRATLFISSPTGGEYSIPLIGSSLPPKPQGPIQIRAGSNTVIPFKNIFPQTVVFSFQVDNPLFSIKGSESIRSKKVNNITVSFEGNPTGGKAPITGKLVISCPRTTGTGHSISWTYYLKGVPHEK
ncbi:hydrocephalus-inducing protein homolog [Rhinatrema bivittatum]|uniref:hydrocephalus-inducing protein homolog n=1 Tax=Rhinatrema bivittatum TaxID=194408 RepID=UPI00112E4E10|nr:hydrocephalus-inducing protein homolog [Rhinatrema bivittatum]